MRRIATIALCLWTGACAHYGGNVFAFASDEGLRLNELRAVLQEVTIEIQKTAEIDEISPDASWRLSNDPFTEEPMLTLGGWGILRDSEDRHRVFASTPPLVRKNRENFEPECAFVVIRDLGSRYEVVSHEFLPWVNPSLN